MSLKSENLRNAFKNEQILTRNELKFISGEDIRKYRDEKCYTQAYVANELGIGQSAYQKIEAGEVKISIERLIKIANILDKPIEVFINDGDKSKKLDNNDVNADKITISAREFDLMNKIILQQERHIIELEEKLRNIAVEK
ncbi:helix-turn-helix domain-containing protein [Pedobacter borealis]|uniref:helix-turn-helix domain-containing protein n=1 Tax=Pedobacter borealis TaxID=475254 RepID=UPI00068ABD45|nr:helix-turn-helix transcriptional regulator [Pedobacter borealis]